MKYLLLISLLGSACATTTTTTPPGGDDGGPVVGPPQVAWKDMTHKQQARFMEKVVVPKFAPVFQGFDGKMFHDFGCKTCHAKSTVEDHSFHMPNPEIYVLPEAPDDFGKLVKAKPEWMKLMGGVEEEMATTLGLPPFDPKAPSPAQFGCFGCHTHKPGGAGDLE